MIHVRKHPFNRIHWDLTVPPKLSHHLLHIHTRIHGRNNYSVHGKCLCPTLLGICSSVQRQSGNSRNVHKTLTFSITSTFLIGSHKTVKLSPFTCTEEGAVITANVHRNCSHPTLSRNLFRQKQPWNLRIRHKNSNFCTDKGFLWTTVATNIWRQTRDPRYSQWE